MGDKMSKSITNQRLIYKIHSDRFVSNNWNLTLDFDTARRNQEVVSLGDSIALRMIRRMKGNNITEEEINRIKNKKKKATDKRIIQKLNKKLNEMKQLKMYQMEYKQDQIGQNQEQNL